MNNMKKKINISEVKPNAVNPRYIKDHKFKKLVKSIKNFPEMLEKRPIIVDENLIVLGGNMRLKASIEAGLKEVWIDIAEGWSEDQKKEFIIKDNVGFGEWDWDLLANKWNSVKLEDWGMDSFPFDIEGIPTDDDLIGEEKDNKPSIKITFNNINDLESAELELKNILNQYKHSFYSVSQ